jgi:hypothetical protein
VVVLVVLVVLVVEPEVVVAGAACVELEPLLDEPQPASAAAIAIAPAAT